MDFLVRTTAEVAQGFPMMADDIIRVGVVLYLMAHRGKLKLLS